MFFFPHLSAVGGRRCANTSLGDEVSERLSALLNRLTELEQHEKELRVSHACVDEVNNNEKRFQTMAYYKYTQNTHYHTNKADRRQRRV